MLYENLACELIQSSHDFFLPFSGLFNHDPDSLTSFSLLTNAILHLFFRTRIFLSPPIDRSPAKKIQRLSPHPLFVSSQVYITWKEKDCCFLYYSILMFFSKLHLILYFPEVSLMCPPPSRTSPNPLSYNKGQRRDFEPSHKLGWALCDWNRLNSSFDSTIYMHKENFLEARHNLCAKHGQKKSKKGRSKRSELITCSFGTYSLGLGLLFNRHKLHALNTENFISQFLGSWEYSCCLKHKQPGSILWQAERQGTLNLLHPRKYHRSLFTPVTSLSPFWDKTPD